MTIFKSYSYKLNHGRQDQQQETELNLDDDTNPSDKTINKPE